MTKKNGKKAKQTKLLNTEENKILYEKINKVYPSFEIIERIITYKKLCNNIINIADCYKDSFCSDYSYDPSVKYPDRLSMTKNCFHEDYICNECKLKVCGCCYPKGCPICDY